MSERRQVNPASSPPTVNDRWWVDPDQKRGEPLARDAAPAGSRFFRIIAGYDQDQAQAGLTDLNLRMLEQAEPSEGSWAYLALTERRCSEQRLEWVKRQLALPEYARGVVVDSDGLLRVLVTGTPMGERILEMTLGDQPSFDCWIEGEWVAERLFGNEQQGIAGLRKMMRRYLSPEGIERWRETRV